MSYDPIFHPKSCDSNPGSFSIQPLDGHQTEFGIHGMLLSFTLRGMGEVEKDR